jgi:EAL domain-containing protein (putative c-di-GMP-specific phosphodiesterase class I)
MKEPLLPLGVAAMMAVAISVAAGAGVIASGQRLDLAIALAGFLLAGALLIILLSRDAHHRRRFSGVSEMQQRLRMLAAQVSDLTARVDVLNEARVEAPTPPPPPKAETSDFNREFEELRRSIKELTEVYDRTSGPSERHPEPELRREPELQAAPSLRREFNHRRESEFRREPELRREPEPEAEHEFYDERQEEPAEPAAAREQTRPLEHQLEFFLEPIVSFANDATVHYRASLVLEGGGRRIDFDELARQAAGNGLRPDLDGHAVSRALAVGDRLTAKRPGTAIFVPIGPETLASQAALAIIEWQMGRAGHSAINLVFEIDQSAMAALNPRGIEGVARLVRNGARLALARAHGTLLDLAALRDLHFRFITFSAAALPADRSAAPAWAETARVAGEYGFTIGVQGLFYEEQTHIARRWAALGSGPVFAPPRRVKGEAIPVSQIRSAA